MAMTPAVCAPKLMASPGVDLPTMRVMGFSSRPPLCRFSRVTTKSAPLSAAVAENNAKFLLSQNLWEANVSCLATATKERGSISDFDSGEDGLWATLREEQQQSR